MLSIQFHSGVERTWHVGKKVPISYQEVNAVNDIQADGHELEHILCMFDHSNFLIPKGRVVRIFGDLAKTIVANL